MLRFLFTPVLACGTFLCTGAFDRDLLLPPPGDRDFAPRGPRSDATELLDKSIAGLSWSKVRWLDMTIWQKMHRREGFSEISGRYRLGPDMQMCLKLDIQHGNAKGQVQAACDGCRVWRCDHHSSKKVVKALAIPDDGPRRFLEKNGVGGPRPLVQAMRDGLHAPRKQVGIWQDRKVWRVSGKWRHDDATFAAAGLHVTRSVLFIDAETLLPIRAEWFGSFEPDGRSRLLIEMEFRQLIVNDETIDASLRRDVDEVLASISDDEPA